MSAASVVVAPSCECYEGKAGTVLFAGKTVSERFVSMRAYLQALNNTNTIFLLFPFLL